MQVLLLLFATAFACVHGGLGSDATAAAAIPAAAATKRCFPENFMFGSATAAYQVEGGWNETGRTPSIWDDFCRAKHGLQCANVADDFLHRYRDDIQLMVASGLDSFRFSISWSRVMKWDDTSQTMKPNAPGIAFYHALVDELYRNSIKPIVTLYHWDLPSKLHTELEPHGGWLNRDIVDHFVSYADLMFREFGATIDYWSTFNEPWTFVSQGYGNGMAAPGLKHSRTNAYVAAHHVLIAHGAAVERFRELKKHNVIRTDARIGIVLNADFSFPLNASDPHDVAAAKRKMEFGLGWFLTPLVSGKYPGVMQERAGSNLPEFTKAEAALVQGSYDLFMLNHYSSKVVVDCTSPHSKVKCHKQALGWERDLGIDETRPPPGARLSSKNDLGERNCNWFTGYPAGYLETIKWMHAQDPTADILLTENGWCGNDTVDNMDQLWYYQTYIAEVHKAMTDFEIPIIGYAAWSFVDNYEWGSFKPRFGLYYVNFTSETGSKDGYVPKATDLARIPRPAAKWYAQLAKTKCLEDEPVSDDASAQTEAAVAMGTAEQLQVRARDSQVVMGLAGCIVLATPALVWLLKHRRRAGTRRALPTDATETTPLVRTE